MNDVISKIRTKTDTNNFKTPTGNLLNRPMSTAAQVQQPDAANLYQTQKVRLTLSNLLSLLGVVLAQVFRVTLIFGNGIK